MYIHFILWPWKSNSVALAAAGKSTTTLDNRPQPKSGQKQTNKKIGRKIGRRRPPSPQQAVATSKVRIIDSDREESSNWNETCLSNSSNVSFPAFQITCTVKPGFFLLASSQRTFCVQGARGRRGRKNPNLVCLLLSAFQGNIGNLSVLSP